MIKEVKEILFQKTVLSLIIEVIEKESYINDHEMFLTFVKFLKIIAKENDIFYESTENKKQLYKFIIDHCTKMQKEHIVNLQLTYRILLPYKT